MLLLLVEAMLLDIPSWSGVKLIIITCLLPGFSGEKSSAQAHCLASMLEMSRGSVNDGFCLNC